MNKEMDKLIKIDSMITEAYITAMHDQAATRNYNAIVMIREQLSKLEELSKLYASIDREALVS